MAFTPSPFDQTGTVDTTRPGEANIAAVVAAFSEAEVEAAEAVEEDAGEGEGGSEDSGAFDPGAFSVPEVLAFLEANPDQAEAVLAAEAAGKNRKGIVNALSASE